MNASYSEKTSYRIKQEVIFIRICSNTRKMGQWKYFATTATTGYLFKFVANFWKK